MTTPLFKHIKRRLILELEAATTEIKVAMCWFTNKELMEALCHRLKENVTVTLVVLNDRTNNRPDGVDFQEFVNQGGIFYFSSEEHPMHNKYCLIDNTTLITGSYNWTYFAEQKNFENVIVTQDIDLIAAYQKDFDRVLRKCKRVNLVAQEAIMGISSSTIVEDMKMATKDEMVIKTTRITSTKPRYLSQSLGENVHGNIFLIFIPRGTKVPTTGMQNLTTINDDQTSCTTDIRSGESPIGTSNEEIGQFTISDIPPLPKGVVGLLTSFAIGHDGILMVRVVVRETGVETLHMFNVEHLLVNEL